MREIIIKVAINFAVIVIAVIIKNKRADSYNIVAIIYIASVFSATLINFRASLAL